MIDPRWVRRFESLPERTSSMHVVQSYDTASKEGEQNSWSVCTTWLVDEGNYYLIDVLRRRCDYPTLKALAIAHAESHRPTVILIEETGVGTALAAELQNRGHAAIPVRAEQNKETRMAVQAAKFASGHVFLPRQAPWLEELEAELFAFPGSRYDDQVDSTSQALAYEINKSLWTDESLDGASKFYNALALDNYFGRVTGRPW